MCHSFYKIYYGNMILNGFSDESAVKFQYCILSFKSILDVAGSNFKWPWPNTCIGKRANSYSDGCRLSILCSSQPQPTIYSVRIHQQTL